MSAHFKADEFMCRCGCRGNGVKPELIETLERVRSFLGKPIMITSGYRCEAHDAAVGGKNNHTTGLAADLACSSGAERADLLAAVLASGFRRVGIGATFVHVDLCRDRPNSVWLYPARQA